MKLSHDWLNKYVNLSDKSTDDIEEALTLIGFEVEGIETHGLPKLENASASPPEGLITDELKATQEADSTYHRRSK